MSYSEFDVFDDQRDVEIFIVDLRMVKHPSSSQEDVIWSLFDNGTESSNFSLDFDGIELIDDSLTLGGTENGHLYGLEIEFTFEENKL